MISLVANLEQWRGKRYDAGALRTLYGDNLAELEKAPIEWQ